jgi:molybdopterin converting factor small subunit
LEIQLQLFSILREKLPPEDNGQTVLSLDEGATLADLMQKLNITRKVVVSVNDVQETDQSRQLNDGDVVMLFSSVSGG